jgi:metallophosphoesterase (TIGR00282 family)
MLDKITVLFFGDIIGRPGRRALKRYLPSFQEKYSPHLVMGNAENAAGGVGITEKVVRELFNYAQVLTSGNHIWDKKEAIFCLENESRILRPANYPSQNPGRGSNIFEIREGVKVAVLNLQGRVFMEPIDCPFRRADEEIEKLGHITPIIIVDFHAEATSEKQALGWYLDGRVSAVIGTHTHVPTSDERILTEGTAYLTDVGMVGGYNTVIGIRKDQALNRFLTARPHRFEPGKDGLVFSAVLVDIDAKTGKAIKIKREWIAEEKIED